jgi:RND family efflux transporter MFP subunit
MSVLARTFVIVTGAALVSLQGAIAQTVSDRTANAGVITALEPLTRRASCLLEAQSVVKLAVATQGTIARLPVERGDLVKIGDVIAQLESDVEKAMLDTAELRAESDALIKTRQAELELAAGKLSRVRELSRRNVSSPQQLEEAIAEAKVASLALEQAKFERELAIVEARRMRASIERRVVRTPVSGVIVKVDQRVGEMADPGRPLAEVAETHVLRVEAFLPVEAYAMVKPGMTAEVRVHEPISVTRLAQVVMKDPQVDAASSLFQVSLRLPNASREIPAGLRCSLRFVETPAR